LANDRNDLLMKTFKIESFYDQNLDRLQSERYSSGRKKHHRRCANDIERQHKCPYQKCEKFYGSEGSLNLHIKIKHGGGNKTDREKIAKSIVFAKANGINMSAESLVGDLNLPPGAVEKAAQQVGIKLDDDSIKKLEQDLITKQEIKKKKELEIIKQQQAQQDLPPALPTLPTKEATNDGVFKVPPIPVKKPNFSSKNTENDALVRNVSAVPALKKSNSKKDENSEPIASLASIEALQMT